MEYLGQIPDRPSAQKAMYCPQVPFQEYIWVPGVCSSNAHHETGDPACLCGTPGHTECTPADEGFYIIQYTLLPTDCGGGGATPGNGPGTSPVTTGPYSPHGSGGIPNLNTPCAKIADLFLQQSFIDKYDKLTKKTPSTENVFNLNHELAVYMRYPTAGTNTPPAFVDIDLPACATDGNIPSFEEGMAGLMHTHNNESCNGGTPVKAPSPTDIQTFVNILIREAMQYTGSYGNAYSFVATENGNYMLMYNGTNYPGSINYDQWKTLNSDYTKAFEDLYMDKNTVNQTDLEKVFTKFMKEKINKPGLEVYRVTATSRIKIEYNPASKTVKETPCPI